MSLDRLTKELKAHESTESSAGLRNTTEQSQQSMKKDGEEDGSPSADLNDPEPPEDATDQIFGHCGTGD